MKIGFVYIMSNKHRTVLYIGVTSDLRKRVSEHKEDRGSEFTNRYNCKDLVYYEQILDIEQAIIREKKLKNWHREWKINLIKSLNPEMKDLFDEL